MARSYDEEFPALPGSEMDKIRKQLDAEAEARAKPLRAYNDAQMARMIGAEALRQQKLKALGGNAVSNIRAMGGEVPPELAGMGRPELPPVDVAALQKKQRLQNYAAMNPSMMRQLSVPQATDPNADTPEDVARKAAMNGMVLRGSQGGRGVSEVSGGGQQARRALQAELADPRAVAARKVQSDIARQNELDYASNAKQRPKRLDKHEKAALVREQRFQNMQRLMMAQAAPQIAMLQAQHGFDPRHAAEANYYKAATFKSLVEGGMPPQEALKHPLIAGEPPPQPAGPPPGSFVHPPGQPTFANNGIPSSRPIPEGMKRLPRVIGKQEGWRWQMPSFDFTGAGGFQVQ